MTTIGEQQFQHSVASSLNRIANALEGLLRIAREWDEYLSEQTEEEA